MSQRRSETILQRPDFSFNRSIYKSMGFDDETMARPVIGIANSYSELVPGSYHLRSLAEAVRRGISEAGGMAVEFGIIDACDKIIPGLLMAAARLDLPAIVLPGGPMLGGLPFDGRP